MAQYLNVSTEDTTDQILSFIIEGVEYLFRLRFNYRSEWQGALYDPALYDIDAVDNEAAKIYGEKKLMPFQDFLKYADKELTIPAGSIYLIDTEYPESVDYEYPTRYNLGTDSRFVLVYFEEGEV